MNFWCVTPFFIKKLIKIITINCVLCYHNQKCLTLCHLSWLNAKNVLSKPTLTREVTSSRFHGYLLSFAFLSNTRGNDILAREVLFSYYLQICLPKLLCLLCLLCLFLKNLGLSSKFLFQLHPPDMESSTNPSLYKFTLMSLALPTITIFNSVFSTIATTHLFYYPRSSYVVSFIQLVLFLMFCFSYNLSLLPSFVCFF